MLKNKNLKGEKNTAKLLGLKECIYQERWWQPISQNALSKHTNSTEVHPGAENLQIEK